MRDDSRTGETRDRRGRLGRRIARPSRRSSTTRLGLGRIEPSSRHRRCRDRGVRVRPCLPNRLSAVAGESRHDDSTDSERDEASDDEIHDVALAVEKSGLLAPRPRGDLPAQRDDQGETIRIVTEAVEQRATPRRPTSPTAGSAGRIVPPRRSADHPSQPATLTDRPMSVRRRCLMRPRQGGRPAALARRPSARPSLSTHRGRPTRSAEFRVRIRDGGPDAGYNRHGPIASGHQPTRICIDESNHRTPCTTRVESGPGDRSRIREELPLSTRVHELAKELGLKSQELLERIQKWGLDVKASALASLDPPWWIGSGS